jgi:hypothetical protein
MITCLRSKLGVPIKTTVSATVLEEALNAQVEVSQLELGKAVCRKVHNFVLHYFSLHFLLILGIIFHISTHVDRWKSSQLTFILWT